MKVPRIVVVDDDDAVRAVIAAAAQEALPTAQITEYFSSLAVLQEIERGAADLLITNFQMPDLDGATLVKSIRAQKNPLPIIMVSGSDEARELGEGAGIDRFVSKSAIFPSLKDALYSLLEVE